MVKGDNVFIFDFFDFNVKYKLIMLIIDLVFCFDFEYEKIVRRFFENLEELEVVFVKVWFKFIYWDMGFKFIYVGFEVLKENFIW